VAVSPDGLPKGCFADERITHLPYLIRPLPLMTITTYGLVNFLHILLFAYWLGADLGVFYGARRAARPGLTYQERIKIRQVVMVIDMAPRTALILMLPVGFHLSSQWNPSISTNSLAIIWVAGLAWLAIMWAVHFRVGTAFGELLRKVDLGIRYLILVSMVAIGVLSLLGVGPFAQAWLAAKALLFAVIICLGLGLRIVGARNTPVMEKLRLEQDVAAAEVELDKNHKAAATLALSLWFIVAVMAFLGTLKPF
jgi:hypothetical protein